MTESSTALPPARTEPAAWIHGVSGTVAGMANVVVGQPLDTIKVRIQLYPGQYTSAWQCARHTMTEEGVLALYKGMASPLVGIGAVNALLFAANARLRAALHPGSGDPPLTDIALAGAGAGAINSVLAAPVELVKIRRQAQTKGGVQPGPLQVVQQLLREDGVRRGLFRGFWATVAREIPAYAGFYCGFEATRRLWVSSNNNGEPTVSQLMSAGAVGGVAYWLACYPLDVVKSVVQNSQEPLRGNYVFTTLRQLYVQDGLSSLVRGIGPTVLRSIPAAAATFTAYELTVQALHGEDH